MLTALKTFLAAVMFAAPILAQELPAGMTTFTMPDGKLEQYQIAAAE
jgi:hypothetical protein